MEIKYKNIYDGQTEEDVAHWVYKNIDGEQGIENCQAVIIDLLAVLTDKMLEINQDQEFVDSIAYAIKCFGSDHKVKK